MGGWLRAGQVIGAHNAAAEGPISLPASEPPHAPQAGALLAAFQPRDHR